MGMNELSLFSGAGGGLLGTMLLGFRPIGYVEWDDYCQRVIAARIRDRMLPDAPIFGDIKTFISDGYAASYTGLVDVITAGFPCQPFSVAGKQKGAADERNMWPATATVIGIVKPRFVLLENVPGVRTYLPVVVRDLRRLGYEVSRPLILGADDVGAPHRRKRVWIMANSIGTGTGNIGGTVGADRGRGIGRNESSFRQGNGEDGADRASSTSSTQADVANTPQRQDDGRERRDVDGTTGSRESINTATNPGCQDVAHADETGRREQRRPESIQEKYNSVECSGFMGNSERTPTERISSASGSWDSISESGWWHSEPDVGRVAHGVANRVDRLKALGNGQVSLSAAVAWKILSKMA
jgi:DNA (cytosine-5)-methyltransferase 1